MGMSTGSPSGGVKSDINMTPLVDIVLVLLIIFLVTMPVMMRTVSLEVPRAAEETEQVPGKSIVITQRADLSINFSDGVKDDRVIAPEQIAKELRPLLESKSGEKVVFVDFCEGVPWQQVVGTMDHVRSVATDEDHNEIKVALKKKDKKSQIDPNKPDPCELR